MKRFLLCVVILLVYAEAYAVNDYEYLTAKFPEHRRVIEKVYDKYSGWVIALTDKYGTAPLLALDKAESIDVVIPIMSKYAPVFTDVYDSLSGLSIPDSAKAQASLSLLLAFTVTDSANTARYMKALDSANRRDRITRLKGREANRYARQIINSDCVPANFLDGLKREDIDAYTRLMHEISGLDYDTLTGCINHPDAAAFLINTGHDGLRLIDETGGQVIALSWMMNDEEQKHLPEAFTSYPGFSEAVNYCGAESYFAVMECPEFYFQLRSLLNGTKYEQHTMTYAVITRHMDTLKGLAAQEAKHLAYYAAELMNLPDDEMFGSSIAPINEAEFFTFIRNYGDDALNTCRNFSALIDVSGLMISGWDGINQDILPVLDAVREFGNMGLQAALYFRAMPDTQRFILSCPEISKRKVLLMFMFYDEICRHHYTKNIGDREKAAKYMFSEYYPDSSTGRPVPVKSNKAVDFVIEHIPGYDIVSPIYDWIVYGKSPTVYDILQGGKELIENIPALKAIKAISAAAKYVSFTTEAAEKVSGAYDTRKAERVIDNITALTVEEMTERLRKFFHEAGKRSVVVVSEVYTSEKQSVKYIHSGKISEEGTKAIMNHLMPQLCYSGSDS